MKRILPLITGALIALGAMLSVVSPASASVPPEHTHSALVRYGGYTFSDLEYAQVWVYRDGKYAGEVELDASDRINHLGQHTKTIGIVNMPGINIHARVDSGSSVVDYHTTTGGSFAWTFYYPVRKFRITLDDWGSGWFAPPISSPLP